MKEGRYKVFSPNLSFYKSLLEYHEFDVLDSSNEDIRRCFPKDYWELSDDCFEYYIDARDKLLSDIRSLQEILQSKIDVLEEIAGEVEQDTFNHTRK